MNTMFLGGEVNQLNVLGDALEGRRGPDQQRIARVGLDWLTLLLAKNQDYGSSVWKPPLLTPETPVDTAVLVRMSDKVARMKTLKDRSDPQVADESLEDTIRDLGAYCLLYLARPEET